jgi:hypothetical protein
LVQRLVHRRHQSQLHEVFDDLPGLDAHLV